MHCTGGCCGQAQCRSVLRSHEYWWRMQQKAPVCHVLQTSCATRKHTDGGFGQTKQLQVQGLQRLKGRTTSRGLSCPCATNAPVLTS